MSKGYKVTIKGAPHSHKLPLFCPHCTRPTGTIDDRWLLDLGICSLCVVNHVEERTSPTINLAKYAPQGGMFFDKTEEEIESYFLNFKNKE